MRKFIGTVVLTCIIMAYVVTIILDRALPALQGQVTQLCEGGECGE